MWLIGMDQVKGDLPYELTCGSHVIGRSRSCDLMIREPTLSRQHARVWIGEEGQITVEDLQSKNGTFVDDVRIKRQSIGPKTLFRLGEIRLFLSPSGPELDPERAEETLSAKGPPHPRPVANLPIESLTAAQRQVFDLIVAGCDEAAAAERLKRSVHTVHLHVQSIFRKLGVHSRAELLALVIRSERPRGLPSE